MVREWFILVLPCVLLSHTAQATDTWTEISTGVDHLHRVTTGSTPQDLHVVRVDLSLSEIRVQASGDASGTERGVSTSTFADSIGATVAINGDWIGSSSSTPLSLAIGNGSQRTLPNHIGVVVQASADSECELSSGRWCDGDELNTCTGGSWLGP